MDDLRERGLDDVLVVAGGTIPKADIPRIKALGVAEVFGPGTRLATIVDYIRDNAPRPSRIVVTADDILPRLQGSDRRALPRLATLVENGDPRRPGGAGCALSVDRTGSRRRRHRAARSRQEHARGGASRSHPCAGRVAWRSSRSTLQAHFPAERSWAIAFA